MKTMSVRELRQSTPRLKETLAREGQVLLLSNGEPIGRLLPVEAEMPRPKLPSLKAFRAKQPKPKTSIEQLIREDRDRR